MTKANREPTPDKKPLTRDSDHQKRKKNNKFRRRVAIGAVIGHLKIGFERLKIILTEENLHKSMHS